MWLDDFVNIAELDPNTPLPENNDYYKDGNALLDIIFEEDTTSEKTQKTINEINKLLENNGGVGLNYRSVYEIGYTAVIIAMIIIVVIIILFTDSYISALCMFTTIGVAIFINMGTNIILGSISEITLMAAAVIQLAVSIDYSLIFFKNIKIARDKNESIDRAIIEASIKSFKTILASALTTIAGFLALGLMNYKIGSELGIVLAKGVIFSLLTVTFLLPALVKLSIKLIDKTKHRALLPSINGLSKLISGKLSIITLILVIGFAVFGFYGQLNNEYLYSDNSVEYTDLEEEIVTNFGEFNQLVLLVPISEQDKELAFVNEAYQLQGIRQIRSLRSLFPNVPFEYIPEETRAQFLSDKHFLINITMNAQKESEVTFELIEKINDLSDKHFSKAYLVGESAVIYDTKNTVEDDYLLVIIISTISIALIILLTFKSLTIPILLMLVIQTAIWLNMAIPYFQGIKISFLGYILISSIQLGATIDYAIIMTDHYEEARKSFGPLEASKKAFQVSSQSIIISMLVLIIAGFSLSMMMDMDLIKELGVLIGRGTFFSGLLSLIFLPPLLILFDKIVTHTTLKRKTYIKK